MARPNRTLPQLTLQQTVRFKTKVDQRGTDECWAWTASTDEDGYGVVRFTVRGKDTPFRAHRISYFIATGIDPAENLVCHKCDNPPCCNPAHLFLGTHGDNARDRTGKRRGSIGSNHYFHLRPESVPRGENHGMAKLTEAQVLEIRKEADQCSRYELARRYGVNKRMIQFIIQRKSWRHI